MSDASPETPSDPADTQRSAGLDLLFLETDTSTGSLLDELGLSDQTLNGPGQAALALSSPERGDGAQTPEPAGLPAEGSQPPLTSSAIGHALLAKLNTLSGNLPQPVQPPLDNQPHLPNNDRISAANADEPTPSSNVASQQQPRPHAAVAATGAGGTMDDFSAYRDLSQDQSQDNNSNDNGYNTSSYGNTATATLPRSTFSAMPTPQVPQAPPIETDFSGNVQTLIRLVSDLPEGVTKQTGAQIIRLTMEAMGISMEEVLSEAQSAQTDMLDAVRSNIRKIEELKAVIRKLETDNKLYQGKANELSEIIDLFVLSSPSPSRIKSAVDELSNAPAYPASGF